MMTRHLWITIGAMLPSLMAGQAVAQHEHGHHGRNYYGALDDFNAHHSTTDAKGEIFLTLNPERTELSYRIELDELVDLKQNPADRTQPDDIIGIHLHLNVPGTTGPHLLNIFGLATYNTPAEEDADLVIDYENQRLTGKWDISDATRDAITGEILPQFFPLTSKIITDWLDELDAGELMVAVHTLETGFPTMAIHGHIHAVVPEPTTGMLLVAVVVASAGLRIERRRWLASGR
jgi:hypothetical protein